jgi:hypothetical protein
MKDFEKERLIMIQNIRMKMFDIKPNTMEEGEGLEGACWEGYEPIGTKILDGKEVPNCVPIKE